jgi:hypothetical protein
METYREHNGIAYTASNTVHETPTEAHRAKVAAWMGAWRALAITRQVLWSTFTRERKAELKAMSAAELTAAFAPIKSRKPRAR